MRPDPAGRKIHHLAERRFEPETLDWRKYWLEVHMPGLRRWAFPLIVVGMNSIAAYCIAHLFDSFVFKALKTHLGQNAFKGLGPTYEPLLHGAAVLLVLWLMLYWMYRRKIFLRI